MDPSIAQLGGFLGDAAKAKMLGDFGKYLERIKITEHPFMQVMTDRKGGVLKPNEYLWKAEISFTEIPKTGRMDVFFI